MVYWMCNYCGYINEVHQQYRCSRCDILNNDILIENNKTESTSNMGLNFNSSTDFQWNCSLCTFLNQSVSLNCEICKHPTDRFVLPNSSHRVSKITRMQSIDETVVRDDLTKDLLKAKKIRNEIILKLENQLKFTDPEFPANSNSIRLPKPNYNELLNDNQKMFSNIHHTLGTPLKWLRPDDLRGDEYSNSQLSWTVTRNPSSDDIVQGKLGNCWLLTGLALIADTPNMLDRILITKEIDPYGIYQVRLCKDGMWTVVTIDDLFPANQFDQMIYSRANRKQLWVSLIEKAAAKMYGSYESLTLGYCADGLSMLTGSPCETIKLSNLVNLSDLYVDEEVFGSVENITDEESIEEKHTEDSIWAILLSAKDANFYTSVSCGSPNDDSEFLNELNQLGLRNLHAYAILDIRDIPSNNLRLLRLKNPWARLTWKGQWSDLDSCWDTLPDHIRNELLPPGVSSNAGGVFWISWKDVLNYFFVLDICRYQFNWHETRMQTHLPWPIYIDLNTQELYMNIDLKTSAAIPESNGFNRASSPIPEIEENNTCAVLTVLELTQLKIVLWQCNCRSKKQKPIDIMIVICTEYKSAIGSIIASSNRQTSSYVTCEAFLDKGTYTIFYISLYYWQYNSQMDFNNKFNYNLNFNNSDLNNVLFKCTLSVHSSKHILLKRATLIPEMITQVISDLAILKGRMQLFGMAQVYTLMKGYSGMIMLVVNPRDNSDIRCTCDCTGSMNLRNSRGKNVLKSDDIVPSGYSQIITVLTQDDAYASYSLQHKYTASTFHLKKMTECPKLIGISDKNNLSNIQLILHQPLRLD